MANQASRLALRLVVLVLICVVAFYVGRPLYWKLSATLQEVREKNYDAKAVRDGFTQLIYSAQKSVGWFNDESDAGVNEKSIKKLAKKVDKTKKANPRRFAYL